MSKTALWDKLGKTDPAHTKSFKRAGGFSGTAIKPMWAYRRMTEEFGPCGEGWGVNEPSFQVVPGNNGEVLVYCTVSVWHGEQDKVTFGVGGDKVVTYIKANEQYNRPERWENDDEAFKKAYTDAVTNALKMIGVGADVHMGMFDDNKYVNSLRTEFAEKPAAAAEPIKRLSKEKARPVYERLSKANRDLQSIEQFDKFWAQQSVLDAVETLPFDWTAQLSLEKDDKAAELGERAGQPFDLSGHFNSMDANARP